MLLFLAEYLTRYDSAFGVFEYLTLLRMQKARELLQETQLPMYEIASKVGYESDLAFTKTFKKHTGTTPTRYRKQAGSEYIPDVDASAQP